MGDLFRGWEIVKLGIRIEENGVAFYSFLTRTSKDPRAVRIFEFLTGEEKRHIAAFEDLLQRSGKWEAKENYPVEYVQYLSALADASIFTHDEAGIEMARKAKSDIEALELGIRVEKDSILFYMEMQRFVPDTEKNVVQNLIEQEREHLTKLSGIRDTVEKENRRGRNG
jgi:rubrerythrin